MSNEVVHSDSNPSYEGTAAIATLYKACKLDTARNSVVLASAASDIVIGINQETTVQAGEAVALKRGGYSLATVGSGGWTKGCALTADSAGGLIATTTAGDKVCAIAMEAANATEFGEVLLLPYPVKYSSL